MRQAVEMQHRQRVRSQLMLQCFVPVMEALRIRNVRLYHDSRREARAERDAPKVRHLGSLEEDHTVQLRKTLVLGLAAGSFKQNEQQQRAACKLARLWRRSGEASHSAVREETDTTGRTYPQSVTLTSEHESSTIVIVRFVSCARVPVGQNHNPTRQVENTPG